MTVGVDRLDMLSDGGDEVDSILSERFLSFPALRSFFLVSVFFSFTLFVLCR